MQDSYDLVRLVNGAFSVHSHAHRETFHPVIGPVAEAEALYVKQLQVPERLQAHTGEFVIWDVGLGAAANVLTVLRATQGIPGRVRIVSFDHTLGALEFALAHAADLGYFTGFETACKTLCSAHRVVFQHGANTVEWELHLGDFPTLLHSPAAATWPKPHAILFDAFSPATNPTMWTLPIFTRIHALLDPTRPCTLPTYSRSTLLRVTLLLAGFYVGAGHATGEKEETTLAANRLELLSEPLGQDWLKRVQRSTSAEPLHTPEYRQSPLAPESWARLQAHPQFRIVTNG